MLRLCEYVQVSYHRPDVVGETGAEVEGGNEVLDEREEEDEAVVHSCSRRGMRAVWVWPRKAEWGFGVLVGLW